jgi:hypothetical protein
MTRPRLHPLAFAAILLLMLGCAQHRSLDRRLLQSIDELKVLVDEHVPDSDRADIVHGLFRQFTGLAQGFYNDQINTSERIYLINRNYNAVPADFEAQLLRLQQRRGRTYGQMAVLALEARTFVSREEWDAIHQDLRESQDR